MNIVVTGGAGFIGSCIIRRLNDLGYDNIYIVDNVGNKDKWLNIRNKRYLEYYNKEDFFNILPNLKNIDLIIHMGAQSSTTERNFDYLYKNNYEYTKRLWEYCANNNIRFIYASSAATYGDGKNGFNDENDIDQLLPLNGYGYSKHIFDLWVKRQAKTYPKQYVGLKFFNVYGPNEYFKESMASMVFHGFNQIMESGKIKLFKSCNNSYADGKQLRDFVYVKDICNVIEWLINNPHVNGLYNVGSGEARTFEDLAKATFKALNMKPNIEYIDMPEHLREKYQYYTKAEMAKLYKAGYDKPMTSLEDGINDYVKNYLNKKYENY